MDQTIKIVSHSGLTRGTETGLTRLLQNRHGPDPSCSHTTRPHFRQLFTSLCLLPWQSQWWRPESNNCLIQHTAIAHDTRHGLFQGPQLRLTFCGRLSGQPRHSSVVKQVNCRGYPAKCFILASRREWQVTCHLVPFRWTSMRFDPCSPKISRRIVQWLSTYTAVNDLVRS
jgi:hypothetical protein